MGLITPYPKVCVWLKLRFWGRFCGRGLFSVVSKEKWNTPVRKGKRDSKEETVKIRGALGK